MFTTACNDDRADWAQSALNTFAEVTAMDTAGEDTETIIGDLLTNLMHLCKREGIDFQRKLTGAEINYDAECAEEEEQAQDEEFR